MPLPVSLTLLIGALAIGELHGVVYQILLLVFVGLALLNELLRFVMVRGGQPQPANEYTIPAARQRTPIVHPDADAS